MPSVSETTDYAKHFGIWHFLFYGGEGGEEDSGGGGGGGSGSPLEIMAFFAHSHPTIKSGYITRYLHNWMV